MSVKTLLRINPNNTRLKTKSMSIPRRMVATNRYRDEQPRTGLKRELRDTLIVFSKKIVQVGEELREV